MRVEHPFEPIYDKNSKILILGSFPSVKSREINFYYAHPQNRFWRVLSKVIKKDEPITIGEKRRFLLDNNIAIWDVVKSCDIEGSSDSSICDVEINDIDTLLKKTRIKSIYFNGKTAYTYFNRNYKGMLTDNIEKIVLPSTSSANATFTLEKLYNKWKKEIDVK